MAPDYRIAIMNEDIGKFGYDSMQQRTKKTRNMEKTRANARTGVLGVSPREGITNSARLFALPNAN